MRNGEAPKRVVAYLVEVETNHMGMGKNLSAKRRAKAVVAAILAEDDLWTWPDENGNFR